MKLVKSLLLGAPAALMAFAGAQAADLPSRKAAPIAYVKVCDAYGAGFFYIPGTDTCLKVGGYVRAEYQYTPSATMYNLATKTPFSSNTNDTFGIRARGRVDLDARTQTAWGTVRTVMGLRLQTQSGQYGGFIGGDAGNGTAPALEAAFVQFAGFTAGRAGENFAFMPPFTWTGQHFWAGYPIGMKQLAYTATFGGGFSATIAIEDRADFGYMNSAAGIGAPAAPLDFPNTSPALVGNVRVDQAWGAAQIMGTVGQNRAAVNFGPTYEKTGWAIGAGLKFNLPMLAAGDSLWLTAAYADGFLDQLQGANTNSNFPDSSQNSRGVYRFDQNMYVDNLGGGAYSVGSTKGYSLGALLVHYWAPTWRSVFAASYINLTPPDFVRAADVNAGGLSRVHGYNLSGSLIWSPVANFDIGAEVQYRKIEQSINCGAGFATTCAAFATQSAGAAVSPGTWDARLRVQRTF